MGNAMTEFRITSDLSAIRGQVIEANFKEVREWLDENLAPYRTMTVTEDMISTAKTYRANIRKVKDRIDFSRKEAKNAALAAYAEFEQKCKTLTGLCDEAALSLDTQIKAFEDADKEAKAAELKAVYDAGDAEAREYLAWEYLFNPKWLNKGFALDAAKAEVEVALERTANDLATIRGMGGENTAYLLDIYRRTHDLGTTIRKNAELIAAKQAEEQRRREAEERAKIEAAQRANDEAAAKSTVVYAAQDASFAEPEPEPEPEKPAVHEVDFRIWATKEQLTALKAFLLKNGIRYGRVE